MESESAELLACLRELESVKRQRELLVVGEGSTAGFLWLEEELILAGVGGCVDEQEGLERLFTVARGLREGGHAFSQSSYLRVIARLRAVELAPGGVHSGVTAREREILAHIERGLCNKDIANEMGLALSTVKAHIQNLFKKFGVNSRLGLLLKAMKG